ncbi:nucleoplasmin-like protein isoform X2 [Chrysoperla carnea]|uniref:nucleoplasmin-like protein isoform X2 n=1 Tax=Chrysoperla carnea TaxID=189513 RepID=UPI001D07A22F|nr:nucleoplasmin-like protein isoform X2 [Chrysoperla carnea]
MADEYFYALTLQGAKASESWDPETKATDDYQGGHKLVIRQAVLGPEAKEGELNVIQVEAMTWKDTIKIPVATLKAGAGGQSQCLLELTFPDPPVTFSLSQGTGPVHIIGHHLIGSPIEEFDEIDEMEEEMLDEEEGEDVEDEDDDEEGPKKKAKVQNNAKGKSPAGKNKKK